MARTGRRWWIALIVALAAGLLVPLAVPATAAPKAPKAPKVRTITDGLVGPLGLAIGRHGAAYVAEAFGGQITRVARDGTKSTVFGRQAVSISGGIDVTRHGRVVFTFSKGEGEASPPNRAGLAKVRHHNRKRLIAVLSRYEQRRNPDQGNTYGFVGLDDSCEVAEDFQPYTGRVDSNPYAVAAHHGGYLVADAAGNDIVWVSTHHGRTRIRTVGVLPPIPQTVTADLAEQFHLPDCAIGETFLAEPVPTDVEIGPHGRLYVTSLPGGAETPGSGSVFTVNPWNGDVDRVTAGLSGAVDLAVGGHGQIYVAELTGNRISVVRHGHIHTFVKVPAPGAVEVGRHGTVYATTNAVGPPDAPPDAPPPNGTLVKITTGRHHHHH